MTGRRYAILALVCAVGFLIEWAVAPALGLPAGLPVMLVVVAVLANVLGPDRGAVVGFLVGLVSDVAPGSQMLLGVGALAGCLLGYVAGQVRVDRSPLSGWLRLCAATVAAAGFAVAADAVLTGWRPDAASLGRAALIGTAGTGLLLAFLLPLRPALRRGLA